MKTLKLALVESADIDLECAQEQLAHANQLLSSAWENVYQAACAQQRSGDEIGARKLHSVCDSIRTRITSVDNVQRQIGQKRGLEFHPDCVCGYSSRCEVHP